MNPIDEHIWLQTRRQILRGTGMGLGAAVLATLGGRAVDLRGGGTGVARAEGTGDQGAGRQGPGVLRGGHFPARAKRVIYLFMAGAPSQLDLFDHKPKLAELYDTDLPPSIR